MQPNKSIKIFINYFLGPVLFIWLSLSIYNQIKAQPELQTSWLHIKKSFYSNNVVYISSVLLLMSVNWGLEAWKWKFAVSGIYPLKFWEAYKAVLTGVSFSVTTPNRMGEYVGRIMYLPEGNRLKTISVTLITSLSQLLITIFSGIIGLILIKDKIIASGMVSNIGLRFVFVGLLLMLAIILLLYLRISGIVKIFERWFKNSRHLYLVKALQEFSVPLLFKLLLLSFFRYCVFVVQYILLYQLFDVAVPIAIIWCVISVLFLAMAIIPTIALIEVGLRGEISLRLMGLYTANSLGVGLTTISIWLINLIVPAVIGSLLILSIKVFKRRNEES